MKPDTSQLVKVHIATGDFCFIEYDFHGTAEDAIRSAQLAQQIAKEKVDTSGLPPVEWRSCIDSYLNQIPFDYQSVMDRLSQYQRDCLNDIKKSRARGKEKGELQDKH